MSPRPRSIKPETPAARWRRADFDLQYNEWALYRFWGVSDELLYIGITGDPVERWRKHALRKPWWHEVTRISMEILPTRAETLVAERAAIAAERPTYNRQFAVTD